MAVLAVGCGDDDGGGVDSGTVAADGGSVDSGAPVADGGGAVDGGDVVDGGGGPVLTIAATGLPALGADYVYEGWLVVEDAPVSAGRFTVDSAGVATPSSFPVDAATAAGATVYVLTIEPATGDDPAPSATHLLAGGITDGAATLTLDHGAALGTDFADATGTFILATPSSSADDDEGQGIWWLVPPTPTAGLSLPTLPDGWAYEGWVVADGTPVSTGTFTDVAAADSDGAGGAAGDQAAPPFPGQDFVDPARDLTSGHMAVISVEPMPDDSPAPFAIKPLVAAIGSDLAPTSQTMTNMAAATAPTASVVIE